MPRLFILPRQNRGLFFAKATKIIGNIFNANISDYSVNYTKFKIYSKIINNHLKQVIQLQTNYLSLNIKISINKINSLDYLVNINKWAYYD
jgi:hypothetical protein